MEQAFQVEDNKREPQVWTRVCRGWGSWVTGRRLPGLEGLLQLPTLSPTISEARRDLPEPQSMSEMK